MGGCVGGVVGMGCGGCYGRGCGRSVGWMRVWRRG
jgi:hypothetical protein